MNMNTGLSICAYAITYRAWKALGQAAPERLGPVAVSDIPEHWFHWHVPDDGNGNGLSRVTIIESCAEFDEEKRAWVAQCNRLGVLSVFLVSEHDPPVPPDWPMPSEFTCRQPLGTWMEDNNGPYWLADDSLTGEVAVTQLVHAGDEESDAALQHQLLLADACVLGDWLSVGRSRDHDPLAPRTHPALVRPYATALDRWMRNLPATLQDELGLPGHDGWSCGPDLDEGSFVGLAEAMSKGFTRDQHAKSRFPHRALPFVAITCRRGSPDVESHLLLDRHNNPAVAALLSKVQARLSPYDVGRTVAVNDDAFALAAEGQQGPQGAQARRVIVEWLSVKVTFEARRTAEGQWHVQGSCKGLASGVPLGIGTTVVWPDHEGRLRGDDALRLFRASFESMPAAPGHKLPKLRSGDPYDEWLADISIWFTAHWVASTASPLSDPRMLRRARDLFKQVDSLTVMSLSIPALYQLARLPDELVAWGHDCSAVKKLAEQELVRLGLDMRSNYKGAYVLFIDHAVRTLGGAAGGLPGFLRWMTTVAEGTAPDARRELASVWKQLAGSSTVRAAVQVNLNRFNNHELGRLDRTKALGELRSLLWPGRRTTIPPSWRRIERHLISSLFAWPLLVSSSLEAGAFSMPIFVRADPQASKLPMKRPQGDDYLTFSDVWITSMQSGLERAKILTLAEHRHGSAKWRARLVSTRFLVDAHSAVAIARALFESTGESHARKFVALDDRSATAYWTQVGMGLLGRTGQVPDGVVTADLNESVLLPVGRVGAKCDFALASGLYARLVLAKEDHDTVPIGQRDGPTPVLPAINDYQATALVQGPNWRRTQFMRAPLVEAAFAGGECLAPDWFGQRSAVRVVEQVPSDEQLGRQLAGLARRLQPKGIELSFSVVRIASGELPADGWAQFLSEQGASEETWRAVCSPSSAVAAGALQRLLNNDGSNWQVSRRPAPHLLLIIDERADHERGAVDETTEATGTPASSDYVGDWSQLIDEPAMLTGCRPVDADLGTTRVVWFVRKDASRERDRVAEPALAFPPTTLTEPRARLLLALTVFREEFVLDQAREVGAHVGVLNYAEVRGALKRFCDCGVLEFNRISLSFTFAQAYRGWANQEREVRTPFEHLVAARTLVPALDPGNPGVARRRDAVRSLDVFLEARWHLSRARLAARRFGQTGTSGQIESTWEALSYVWPRPDWKLLLDYSHLPRGMHLVEWARELIDGDRSCGLPGSAWRLGLAMEVLGTQVRGSGADNSLYDHYRQLLKGWSDQPVDWDRTTLDARCRYWFSAAFAWRALSVCGVELDANEVAALQVADDHVGQLMPDLPVPEKPRRYFYMWLETLLLDAWPRGAPVRSAVEVALEAKRYPDPCVWWYCVGMLTGPIHERGAKLRVLMANWVNRTGRQKGYLATLREHYGRLSEEQKLAVQEQMGAAESVGVARQLRSWMDEQPSW